MIRRLLVCETDNINPYLNLAVEEQLTLRSEPGEVTMFLWRNRRSVVIGRNQNCWSECDIRALEDAGGHLVRRLSGGGAVFHDLGNLNFSFCARSGSYDVERQDRVILEAVRSLGIEASVTGRNDLTAGGRKFSGNAYYSSGDCKCHHGTLLIDVDGESMSRFLNVDAGKLRSNGVESVRSRTVNLRELRPDITTEMLKGSLVSAFSQVYGLPVENLDSSRLDRDAVARGEERFASWEWRYGRRIVFQRSLTHRFPWGGVEIQLGVDSGVIKQVRVYTDAMDEAFPPVLESLLTGCRCDSGDLAARLRDAAGVAKDLREWLIRSI